MVKYPEGSSDEIQMEVIASLLLKLKAIFPTSGIRVIQRVFIGESNIHIRYTNARTDENCMAGYYENDPAYMLFSIEYDGEGFYIEAPSTHSNVLKNAGVKFRKIKGATEKACADKLAAWFKKNSAEFLKLGLSR
ncbi:hypothetical protein [Stenotrophomonas phage RAS14]